MKNLFLSISVNWRKKFKEMLTWFINIKLGISTRPIPPYTYDNKLVDLLGLYMVVKCDGGYRNVTDNNCFGKKLPKQLSVQIG
ncbi:putative transcription factor & chromatin remodeling ARID family [Helianthus anomalus]